MENDTNAPDVGNKDGLAGGDASHTPGPWKLGRKNRLIVADAEHRWVAVCDEGFGLSTEERLANARLISVAPELLRVVRIVHANDFLAGCISVPGGVKSFKLFVEELLAKVTDGEPANNKL